MTVAVEIRFVAATAVTVAVGLLADLSHIRGGGVV